MATKLKGVKPEAVEKRLKLFLFGDAGSGKTTAAIQFPSPYLIDTERGAENDQYVKALQASGGAHLATSDLDEIIEQVTALLTERHAFRTLIIDPITVPYASACDKAARDLATTAGKGDGTEFGRHKAVADRKVKQLLALLLRLDMNVILTAHGKVKWGKNPQGQFEEIGRTFDAYNKLDYFVDLMIETRLRGTEPWATVQKSRITAFPMLATFELSYAAIADRYGRTVLERGAEPVALATADQIIRLQHLVETVKLSKDKTNEEIIEKWLDKAEAASFAEMPADVIAKCIALSESRFSPEKEAVSA